jgi:hypothetical protein
MECSLFILNAVLLHAVVTASALDKHMDCGMAVWMMRIACRKYGIKQ